MSLDAMEQDVKDIIQRLVPVHTTCPHCQQEIDPARLIDGDYLPKCWELMVDLIVNKVGVSVLKRLVEDMKKKGGKDEI